MNLGDRLYELRKKKNLTQDEAAEKLNVTRQTISKWETNQSQPDFDKIVPICDLYEISTDELVTGIKEEKKPENKEDINPNQNKKTAIVVSSSVFLYFLAVIWIIIAEPIHFISENVMVGVFLLIAAFATVLLVFHFVSISKSKSIEEKTKKEEIEKYDGIISLITTCIYLLISFLTQAWHITWLIWIVFAIVIEIVHLIRGMKGNENE